MSSQLSDHLAIMFIHFLKFILFLFFMVIWLKVRVCSQDEKACLTLALHAEQEQVGRLPISLKKKNWLPLRHA